MTWQLTPAKRASSQPLRHEVELFQQQQAAALAGKSISSQTLLVSKAWSQFDSVNFMILTNATLQAEHATTNSQQHATNANVTARMSDQAAASVLQSTASEV